MQRRKLAGATLFVTFCLLSGVYACSGDSKLPPQQETTPDGSSLGKFDGTVVVMTEGGGNTNDGSSTITDGSAEGGEAGAVPAHCKNGIIDQDETDVDCGGKECLHCIDGKTCIANTDCAGAFCSTGKKCFTPHCNNSALDGNETDVDCGGGVCGKCGFGKKCGGDADCNSSKCDSGSHQCNCPDRMISIATNSALGGTYCIDQTEVAAGDYDRFVRANQSITQQIPECATANTSYVPKGDWPPAQPLSTSYPYPVHFVNWCDAYAYCLWAGKQLCGEIGAVKDVTPVTIGNATDPKSDAWMNACSAEGNNVYPYAGGFNGGVCNGGYFADAGAGAFGDNKIWPVCTFDDMGNYAGVPADTLVNNQMTHYKTCQGGTTNLFGMSGNVAEWENSCTTFPDGGVIEAGAGAQCLVRGGSYTSVDGTTMSCATHEQLDITTVRADIGFRCCQF